jgi:tetratricopeptide (TPR) repeat protein
MSVIHRVRHQRILREAEGYLELGLPQAALDTLARISEPGTFLGQKLYLTGEALRALERYAEAIPALEQAAELRPSEIPVWLALGWCYKRTNRLENAIGALEKAEEVAPDDAIVHYNLACYLSLAGRKHEAITRLARALSIDPDYRDMIGAETDFDPIRNDPEFQSLTSLSV